MRVLRILLIGMVLLGSCLALAGYNESPMLADLVKEGKLPPVEERLPDNPLVVVPYEEIGEYGGTWRSADIAMSSETHFMPLSTEPLIRWNREGNAVEANVAESWEVSEDGKTFTFNLRKGIKWSDGVPLTADDIIFWYEDILNQKELTPSIPGWLKALISVRKDGDYVVIFEFSKPYPLFLENMANLGGGRYDAIIQPKHYLIKYHPSYTSQDELDALAKEAGFDTWYAHFDFKRHFMKCTNVPVLSAWNLVSVSETEQLLTRNPYYWKVDTEGNQLPYIDRVINEVVLNAETLTMKTVAGAYDFQPYRLSLADYSLFKENEEKGGYKVLLWDTALGSNLAIMPNLNSTDPYKHELFNNLNFRIALSLAINREEINDLCYLGLAVPRQATIIDGCPYYTEGLEELYAEYDPKRASEILDSIGLDKKNSDGYRLRPDGSVLELTIFTTDMTLYGPWVDVVDLISTYFNKVGIKTAYDVLSSTLYSQRRNSTDFDIITWAWGRGLHPLLEPAFIFP
ncbi:MAG TPA: ABC transporter substrate-binding protein, partial [Mesotoga infera]|nr:ABC transporter substrate-binding protein [Mesotoga infera]